MSLYWLPSANGAVQLGTDTQLLLCRVLAGSCSPTATEGTSGERHQRWYSSAKFALLMWAGVVVRMACMWVGVRVFHSFASRGGCVRCSGWEIRRSMDVFALFGWLAGFQRWCIIQSQTVGTRFTISENERNFLTVIFGWYLNTVTFPGTLAAQGIATALTLAKLTPPLSCLIFA